MKIKGAIFDMDGTIVDSLVLWDVLWKELGNRYLSSSDFKPTEEDDRTMRTMLLLDSMKMTHEKYKLGQSGEELYGIACEIIMDFYENQLEMKEGARELLDYLYENGVKMCIASASVPNVIEAAMKRCELSKYFVGVVSCADVGCGKDRPDVFLRSLELLGTSIDDTWVLEDSYVAVCTAKKAGFRTVGVYEKCNFCQDILEQNSDVYVSERDDLTKVIDYFENNK